ncbi:hypothetical protein QQF64_016734 [Cirrhinus molitorella]|uniref:Uncharacterized protein n=1 Tax=Cirrhinus molitorella TaxID=172907 RepID=A0ABR3LPZ7_9TELE
MEVIPGIFGLDTVLRSLVPADFKETIRDQVWTPLISEQSACSFYGFGEGTGGWWSSDDNLDSDITYCTASALSRHHHEHVGHSFPESMHTHFGDHSLKTSKSNNNVKCSACEGLSMAPEGKFTKRSSWSTLTVSQFSDNLLMVLMVVEGAVTLSLPSEALFSGHAAIGTPPSESVKACGPFMYLHMKPDEAQLSSMSLVCLQMLAHAAEALPLFPCTRVHERLTLALWHLPPAAQSFEELVNIRAHRR